MVAGGGCGSAAGPHRSPARPKIRPVGRTVATGPEHHGGSSMIPLRSARSPMLSRIVWGRGCGCSLILMSGNGGRVCRTVGEAVAPRKKSNPNDGRTGVLAGIQAYAGHIQHIADPEARRSAVAGVADQVRTSAGRARTGAARAAESSRARAPAPRRFDGARRLFTRSCRRDRTFLWTRITWPWTYQWGASSPAFVRGHYRRRPFNGMITSQPTRVRRLFALNGPPPISAAEERGWTYSYDGDEFGRVTLGPGARRPRPGRASGVYRVPLRSHCRVVSAVSSVFAATWWWSIGRLRRVTIIQRR